MRYRLVFIVLSMLTLYLKAEAQYFPKKAATLQAEINDGVAKLNSGKAGHDRLQVLLKLSYDYLYKKGEYKNDIDSAIALAQEAKFISLQLGDKESLEKASAIILGCFFEDKGLHKKLFQQIKETSGLAGIQMLTYIGDRYFFAAYKYNPVALVYLDTGLLFYQQKLLLSKKLRSDNLIVQSIEHLEHLIQICDEQNDLQRLKNQSDWLSTHTRSLKVPFPSAGLSARLSMKYVTEGSYDKALSKIFYSLKIINHESNYEDKYWTYFNAGEIYRYMGNHEKSNFYYLKLLDVPDKTTAHSLYSVAYLVCYNFRKLGNTDMAIGFFDAFLKKHTKRSDDDQIYVYKTLSENFNTINKPELALQNLLEAQKIAEKLRQNTVAICSSLGGLYVTLGKFEEANKAYEKCEQQMRDRTVAFKASIYQARSFVKAKLNDYQSALTYLIKSKKLDDSLYNTSKAKHAQELEIQYETQKKEAQLNQRADSIRFLKQKGELQQQNAELQQVKLDQAEQLAQSNKAIIKLKERDLQLKTKDLVTVNQIASLQKTQLKQADDKKKITITIIGLLLVVVGLTYRQFRAKRHSNLVITEKNEQLNKLVDEKEWLLKEVHHRVKNNLQTIVNLLESQSDHLDEPAFTAIETSKNRIFAMSLIHHKLYLSAESSKIDMPDYISELVSFLRETFGRSIIVSIDTDPIKLDAGRAIPIGLIINETVTNSLKHAFKDQQQGRIDISFKMENKERATLTISDNGSGLSLGQLSEEPKTMGLKLIRGLARQLDGELIVKPGKGTAFIISSISLSDVVHTV